MSKEWEDENNRDGIRPDALDVTLSKVSKNEIGEETYIPVNEDEFPSDAEVKTPTITLNSDNGWSGTWAKLYKYENGNEIQYKVTENLPENLQGAYTLKDREPKSYSYRKYYNICIHQYSYN